MRVDATVFMNESSQRVTVYILTVQSYLLRETIWNPDLHVQLFQHWLSGIFKCLFLCTSFRSLIAMPGRWTWCLLPCHGTLLLKWMQKMFAIFLIIPALGWQSLSVPTLGAMPCPSLDLLSCRHKRLVKHSLHKLFAAQYQRLTWNVQLLFRIDLKVIFDVLFAISILGVFASWSPCTLVLTGSSLGRFALSRAQRSRGARENTTSWAERLEVCL